MTTVQERKKKAKGQAVIFGILSVALYAAAFAYADPMVKLFARGGAYCLLPVATVFVFSYIHGSFASNVWTALGIEASSKAGRKTQPATEKKRSVGRGRASANA